MNDAEKIKAWDLLHEHDPDATIMPMHCLELEKQVIKLTTERDEYKACKQEWYDKYMGLNKDYKNFFNEHNAFLSDIQTLVMGEEGEWVDLLNRILERHLK